MKKAGLAILGSVLILASMAMSQSRETGAIRRIITDDQGTPLPGVTVTLSGGTSWACGLL